MVNSRNVFRNLSREDSNAFLRQKVEEIMDMAVDRTLEDVATMVLA